MKNKRIYLSQPYVGIEEKELLIKAFDSNWIAPLGPNVDLFESELANYIGIKDACALSSGTAALHLSLRVLGVSNGDRVLCPSLTFAATANAIIYQNAIPIFVDVNKNNWTIDCSLLEHAIKKYNPKALITVDLYGQSCEYNDIIKLCDQYGVLVVEDAAEALGSEFNGKKLGMFGDIGIFSFNGNKIITTSGGGMLVSSNEKYVSKARFLSMQAREPVLHYEHKELGFNYRMSNLLAAVGRGQLLKLDSFVKSRRKIFRRYYKGLKNIKGIDFLFETNNSTSNRWLTTLIINENSFGVCRDNIINALEKENIESRPIWKPMHLQEFFQNYDYVKGDMDISFELFQKGICLPSSSNLSLEDQDRIIDIIRTTFN